MLALFGLGALVWIARDNRGRVMLVASGRLVRARCAQVHAYKSYVVVRLTYATPDGPVSVGQILVAAHAERVLAEAEPVVAYADARPREPFALAVVAGLRCPPYGGALVPAPWPRLLWAAAPLVVLVLRSCTRSSCRACGRRSRAGTLARAPRALS